VIVIYRIGELDFLDPKGEEPFRASAIPTLVQIRRLIQNEVTISDKVGYWHFVKQDSPKAWSQNGMLRYHRLARLDETGVLRSGSFFMSVDPELGVRLREVKD
jgi:hypothetical protein